MNLLRRARADKWLLDLGNLVACSNDGVTSLVLDDLGVLAFPLGALPDLHLATTADDTNPHGREQVVCGVGVEIYTTVEHSGSILAEAALDESLASRVLLDEVGHIVDDTSNSDEAASVLDLLDVIVPLDNGELIERRTPVELSALLVELLLELLDTALLDFVGAELLEIIGKAELAPEPDAPLGRVILEPLDSVTVVRGELVVEVVVSLSESDEGSNDVVPGAVAVIEGLLSEPVGKRVDAEGCLLDEEDAEDTSVDEATHPVAPAEASDDGGENQAHEENDLEVVLVLPDNDGVLVEIRDVGAADTLGVLLHDHPADVAVQQSLADAVGVLGGIGIAVVGAVVTAPPADGALDSTTSNGCEEDAQRKPGRVRLVCPKTMVTSGDAEAGPVVIHDGPDGGLQLQLRPEGSDATHERNTNNEEDLDITLGLLPMDEGATKLTLSQLTCLYQFFDVIGVSVMCGFLGSNFGFLFGSAVLAMAPVSFASTFDMLARTTRGGCARRRCRRENSAGGCREGADVSKACAAKCGCSALWRATTAGSRVLSGRECEKSGGRGGRGQEAERDSGTGRAIIKVLVWSGGKSRGG